MRITAAAAAVAVTTIFRSERGRAMRRWARIAILLVGLPIASCSSCDKSESSAPGGSANVPADLTPVPYPEGLLADFWLQNPEQTWKSMRELAGGPALLLPSTFQLFASTLLGLPAQAAGSIDGNVPVVGVFVGSPQGPRWVVALHVKSGRELVQQLTAGADAKHAARADAATGITFIEPKAGKSSEAIALGVVGYYLLAAESAGELAAAGAYVARSLPTRPAPKAPIGLVAREEALKGPIGEGLRRMWRGYAVELEDLDRANRRQHGGRAPDFGDPAAALAGIGSAVDSLAELLAGAKTLELRIAPQAARLDVRVELQAQKQGELAELLRGLTLGDHAPLLALPKDSLLAIESRGKPADVEAAKSVRERLTALFGDRLSDADTKQVEQTFMSLAKGRGDQTSYALVSRNGEPALIMRGKVEDAREFSAGVRSLFKLVRVRAFAEPIRQFIGDVTISESTIKLAGVDGEVNRVLLTIKPAAAALAAPGLAGKGAKRESKTFELTWVVADGTAHVALARESAPLLSELVVLEKSKTLAADPDATGAANRAGAAAFAVFARPIGLGLLPGEDAAAPVLAAMGRTNDAVWFGVDVSAPAFRALARAVVQP
jgi:hypothetical protein